MRFLSVFSVSHYKCSRIRAPLVSFQAWRCYAQLQQDSRRCRSSFGIAFDIDGVVLRGRVPIGGSPLALKKLYDQSGALKIPFLFLTNGGGVPECRRANDLSGLLGVTILPLQVVQGHSAFKTLVKMYENELIIATGKGEPALVMLEYGFKKVVSLEEYASHFNNIDPVSQYKAWRSYDISNKTRGIEPQYDIFSDIVKATFVVSDPVDWGRDIQVLCDILKCGGLPPPGQQRGGDQPALYFAADDLQYQAAYPSERLGMGAFRIALENVFNRIHDQPLEYTCFGKPNPFVYKNAETVLKQINDNLVGGDDSIMSEDAAPPPSFKTLYMIGDNPSVDIKGARKAGYPWFSILTRSGVFRGEGNDVEFAADFVVDTVDEAVDYILRREGLLAVGYDDKR